MKKLKIWVAIIIVTLFVTVGMQASSVRANQSSNRFSGADRYQTARAIAEEFNGTKCDNVILASGNDFPDALSASILSKKFNAPVLLVDKSVTGSQEALSYITDHLTLHGTIYIVGGTVIIDPDFEVFLKQKGYTVIRLSGLDRYDTNISVATEANVYRPPMSRHDF